MGSYESFDGKTKITEAREGLRYIDKEGEPTLLELTLSAYIPEVGDKTITVHIPEETVRWIIWKYSQSFGDEVD